MIQIDKARIEDFCRDNGIVRLSLFGSVLRDDFRPDSDVDVLVEFAPGVSIGLIGLGGLEIELSAIVGRQVDLHTYASLSRHFRDRVLSEAQLQYAA